MNDQCCCVYIPLIVSEWQDFLPPMSCMWWSLDQLCSLKNMWSILRINDIMWGSWIIPLYIKWREIPTYLLIPIIFKCTLEGVCTTESTMGQSMRGAICRLKPNCIRMNFWPSYSSIWFHSFYWFTIYAMAYIQFPQRTYISRFCGWS